jgi:hypothetical protein
VWLWLCQVVIVFDYYLAHYHLVSHIFLKQTRSNSIGCRWCTSRLILALAPPTIAPGQ